MSEFERLRPLAAAAVLMLFSAACTGTASTPAPAAPEPAAQRAVSSELAAQLIASTAPARPVRLLFDWTLEEREAKFTGKGVTRIESPYRARLDLFGPRGEGYLSAALVDMELRLPERAAAANLPVPPPPLFWTALGVFRPPHGAVLTRSTRAGDKLRLEYSADESIWLFDFENGALRKADWTHQRTGRQTVEVTPAQGGTPREALYRDWPSFRQLTLTLTEATNVDAFPTDIWTPGSR